MNINYNFKNLDGEEKLHVKEHVEEKKMPRLEKLLISIPDENRSLDITIEKTATKHSFIISLRIHIPKNQIMVTETHTELIESLDMGFHLLIRRVRKAHEKNTDHTS